MTHIVTDDEEPALLDHARLSMLEEAIGPEDVAQLLALLAAELAHAPDAIARDVARGDVVAARSGAHALKGAALSGGAMRVASVAAGFDIAGADLAGRADALRATARATAAVLEARQAAA